MTKILFAGTGEKGNHFSEHLLEKGYTVVTAPDHGASLSMLNSDSFDYLITVPGFIKSDDSILKHIQQTYPALTCICLSGKENPKDILPTINKCDQKAGGAFSLPSSNASKKDFQFFDFIGESKKIKQISTIVRKVSTTDSTVLITGESGTGKELIARAIHKNSNRADKPMIVINCGAIPGELLESELFGHEKGAFTSAHRTRIGRFELADGGTLFLDEIGDMSPSLQVKLLRVIQNRQFERVGGVKSINVDVRIISATNKNLKKAIKENAFREDLFYRLNVIPIEVPPLHQRKDDIALLVEHFSTKLQKQNNWQPVTFTAKALKLLKLYHWTGNIRELENFVERMHVLIDSDIVDVDDLPDYIISQPGSDSSQLQRHLTDCFDNNKGFNEAIEAHQRELILHALNKTNWVKAKAAQILKMKRTTLVEKIKKMELDDKRLKMDNIGQVGDI